MTDGLAGEGFDIDLLNGKLREDAFGRVLCAATFEHKADKQAWKTGRVFVEVEQKGRPSGILTSRADWWVVEYYPDCRLILPRRLLRAAADHISALRGGPVEGGDFNRYRGVLVPLDLLVNGRFLKDRVVELEHTGGHDDALPAV